MANGKIEFKLAETDLVEDPEAGPDHPQYDPDDNPPLAYVSLPDHPGEKSPAGAVRKMVRLSDLIDYEGADIFMDFVDGRLIGIEILA